jgi:hypothetical protein
MPNAVMLNAIILKVLLLSVVVPFYNNVITVINVISYRPDNGKS